MRFFFIEEATGAAAEWDEAEALAPVSASVKVSVSWLKWVLGLP